MKDPGKYRVEIYKNGLILQQFDLYNTDYETACEIANAYKLYCYSVECDYIVCCLE